MKPGDPGHTFISKQTPLDVRAGKSDCLPAGALDVEQPRPCPRDIQPEGDGPEVLMEPLRQTDPDERMRGVAQAQAETDIAAAMTHVEAVKNSKR